MSDRGRGGGNGPVFRDETVLVVRLCVHTLRETNII